MAKQIQRSFQEYLSKIKLSKQTQSRSRSDKLRKTSSYESGGVGGGEMLPDGNDHMYSGRSASLNHDYGLDTVKRNQSASFHFESPKSIDPPPPQNLCSSARFFVASGSSSSLITDEALSPVVSASANDVLAVLEIAKEKYPQTQDDFIAITRNSSSPYEDFRRSMHEMVGARFQHSGNVNWEFLEELLFCYLDLNNKNSYRYILRAFVDLVVVLRENPGNTPATFLPWNGGSCRKQLQRGS